MALKVGVVGAGIVGLAAASELTRAGAEVYLYEKTGVAAEQSKGETRIFRLAHADPRLVDLARRAREGWASWEGRFRRRLIGDEGLILNGEHVVEVWGDAMRAAGATCTHLSKREGQERLPIARVTGDAIFDPAGGATRVRRTVEALRAEVEPSLQMAEVTEIALRDSGVDIVTSAGVQHCDEVLLVAGLATSGLAANLGLDIPMTPFLHSRFTFLIREPGVATACWIDDSGSVGPGITSYCQPVGTTGRYAVGVAWEGEKHALAPGADRAAEEERVSEESCRVACDYVAQALPGIDDSPVGEIRCCYPVYPFGDGDDGFVARRIDGVTAFYGGNLFKFAPLLGSALARTVVDGALSPELTLYDL